VYCRNFKTILLKVNKYISFFFKGVFSEDGPYSVYIDVKKISDLTKVTTLPILEIGGGTNLYDLILLLEKLAGDHKEYFYGKDIGAHLRKV